MVLRLLLSTSALRPKSASTVASSRSVVPHPLPRPSSSSSAPSTTSRGLGSSSYSSSYFATPPPSLGRRSPSAAASVVVVPRDDDDDDLRRQRRSLRQRRLRHQLQQVRHHRSSDYDGPGRYDERETGANSFGYDHSHSHDHSHDKDEEDEDEEGGEEEKLALRRLLRSRYDRRSGSYERRGYTVGIGGPVGSGKTALTLALCRALRDTVPMGVVTNDIFTQEDGEFLMRNGALSPDRILPVETGGCPHAAIREDVSANLGALEVVTRRIMLSEGPSSSSSSSSPLLLCESGGDNLAANFSNELADYTIYVIDVAGGDKVPRKGGPGITQSDLLVINKIDLADAVGSDLDVMARDAHRMRRRRGGMRRGHGGLGTMSGGGGRGGGRGGGDDGGGGGKEEEEEEEAGPTVFASVKNGVGLDLIIGHVMRGFENAHRLVESAK